MTSVKRNPHVFMEFHHKKWDHTIAALFLHETDANKAKYLIVYDDAPCMKIEEIASRDLVTRGELEHASLENICAHMTKTSNAGVEYLFEKLKG